MIPRRGAVGLALTAAALVVLLSFKTPTPTVIVGTDGARSPASDGQAVAGTSPGATLVAGATPGGVTAGPTAGAGTARSGQFTGAVADTMYGPVQVQITVSGGQVTEVTALQLPSDRRRSEEISQYAGPILRTEALRAQSAHVDAVSGATYTSQGYEQSLQSALDQAHG
jgi:uncharacterized protein with FMN-binding domain